MTQDTGRFDILIAHAGQSPWAVRLERRMSSLPVGFHWSRTDHETIVLAFERQIHVLVLDDRLPTGGGLPALRRMRDIGLDVPCLLVSPQPDARLLRDALDLGVFTVLEETRHADDVPPTLVKLLRRAYNVDWTVPATFN
jgi:DNA-binding NarL/FixJ family response regulator